LFEECFQRRWYRTAACYILVIAKLEGPAVSQYCALRLLQVRFLLRSGRDYEAAADSDKLSPTFLGYFLLPSTYRRQSLDAKSTSFKEPSAHVASVKNILESHASYLMSGKELSKLVAFVKGTQFDLVEYLQREKYGSARLENFASGLELIGQKLQMGTLQSRLDAEFLLAHMCSVKFKEWIVVLATLLRRSEVLFDLFQHDTRLWKAYSITLQASTCNSNLEKSEAAAEFGRSKSSMKISGNGSIWSFDGDVKTINRIRGCKKLEKLLRPTSFNFDGDTELLGLQATAGTNCEWMPLHLGNAGHIQEHDACWSITQFCQEEKKN
ncbi:hypothetical protein RJ639_014663, partial [Escallonia herrerae]